MILALIALCVLMLTVSWTGSPQVAKLLACSGLLLLGDDRGRCHSVVKWWVVALAVWLAVGVVYSEHPALAMQGHWWRWEGFITWLVLGVLAVRVWQQEGIGGSEWKWEGTLNCVRATVCVLVVVVTVLAFTMKPEFFSAQIMPKMAVGGFAAMAGVLLASWHPVWLLSVIPLVVYSQCRASVVAILVGVWVFLFMDHPTVPRSWRKVHVITILVAVCILSCCLAPKFLTANPSSVGTGPRAQWIIQAGELSHRLPLTGFGLDTQGYYLQSAGEHGALADRVHNVLFDVLLQTGWIGVTLAMLMVGAAVGLTVFVPTPHNRACLAVVAAWIVYGMFNPQGIPAHALMLIALLGIRK